MSKRVSKRLVMGITLSLIASLSAWSWYTISEGLSLYKEDVYHFAQYTAYTELVVAIISGCVGLGLILEEVLNG